MQVCCWFCCFTQVDQILWQFCVLLLTCSFVLYLSYFRQAFLDKFVVSACKFFLDVVLFAFHAMPCTEWTRPKPWSQHVCLSTYICRLDECREYTFRFAVWMALYILALNRCPPPWTRMLYLVIEELSLSAVHTKCRRWTFHSWSRCQHTITQITQK